MAQSTSIRLEGTVWDPSGNPLPGAVLTAVESRTGRQSQAVSDENGRYIFLALQPGQYVVSVKAKEYKEVIERNIFLLMPGTVHESFLFEVSAVAEETGFRESPRSNDSEYSGAFSRRELETLPLLERNPLLLAAYQPGVQIYGGSEGLSTINGTRRTMNNISLDGISVTDPINPQLTLSITASTLDFIEGMQVVTVGGKAEYGRSGGGQVVLISRSGSRSWSGDLYDYYRSENLNANDHFSNSAGLPRPFINQHLFGASISGPAFGENTLLFAQYEGRRADQAISRNRLVLTEEAKSGEFRWYTPGQDPDDEETLQTYNIVANDPRQLGIDPAIQSILHRLPEPNNTYIGDGLNTRGYMFNNPIYNNQDRIRARVDYSLNNNHHLFFRFGWNRFDATDYINNADAPYPNEPFGTIRRDYWGFTIGSDLIINPNMINELRVAYHRPTNKLNRAVRSTEPMFLANTWTNPLDPSFPRSVISPVLEISDNLSHAKGTHVFKYGFTFRRTLQGMVDYSGAYPDVTFGTDNGNAPPLSVGPSGTSVISNTDRRAFENLYNDLLGRMESVGQIFYSNLASVLPAGTARTRDFAFYDYAFFVQDDWRIIPNLTLNLGLRYELDSVPNEQNGLQGVLDKASQVDGSSNISDFTIVPNNNWYSMNRNTFAPRVGFAWDILGTGGFVLRGGYGIFYDRLIGAITNFVDEHSYGFLQTVNVYPNQSGTDRRLSDGIPLPSQPPPPALTPPITRSGSVAIFDSNLHMPRVDHFHLSLEKRLFGAVLEASYVSTRGKKLFQYLDRNQTKTEGDFLQAFKELQAYREAGSPMPPSNTLIRLFGSPIAALNAIGGYNVDSAQVGAAANAVDLNYYGNYASAGISDFYLRNYPQFDRFIFGTNTAESWYDSLQLGLRKNTSNYHVGVYYTWSKSLDTMSVDGTEFVSPLDNLNPQSNKAISDFHRTHVLNFALSYSVPFGRYRDIDSEIPKWIDYILGGWNISTLWYWESGPPFSVTTDRQTQFGGVFSLANFSGSSRVGRTYWDPTGVNYFTPDDRALFSFPEAGEAGTSGRNQFVGPGYSSVDISLYKSFNIKEGHNLQFRVEAYNIFNNTNYGIPVADLSNANFGNIISTQGPPRNLQMSLRYRF